MLCFVAELPDSVDIHVPGNIVEKCVAKTNRTYRIVTHKEHPGLVFVVCNFPPKNMYGLSFLSANK